MKATDLTRVVQSFFVDWLGPQRNLSPHTIASYRDCWRLYLRSLVRIRSRQVDKLRLTDIDVPSLLSFLDEMEEVRGVSIATRNNRLAAIKSFARFVIDREPASLDQFSAILRVPQKRAPQPLTIYLEKEEVDAILRQPDKSKRCGRRDYVLLTFLYFSGARIQEALDVTPDAFRFEWPAHVRILGKGRKQRVTPIGDDVADLIQELIQENQTKGDEAVFRNRYGDSLTPGGARFKLKRYVAQAARQLPSIAKKHVSPHTFRHSFGVQMIASNVDITTIASWMGHSNLETTNHYATANLRTKRAALERFGSVGANSTEARWTKDMNLLTWLDNL